MGKLCLGTYLQILYNAKSADRYNTKKRFVEVMLSLLCKIYDNSDTAMSKIFTGINNPTADVIKKAASLTNEDYPDLVEKFRRNIMPKLNPNKLSDAIRLLEVAIAEDTDIKHDTVVDLVTGLKKNELTGKVDNQEEFLTGVYLYVMKYTKNPGKSEVIKRILKELNDISQDYVFEANKKEESIKREEVDQYDEQNEQQAAAFCIKYDLKKEWIPLCQVAQITHPIKNHSREMYNDYCLCTRSVRQKILDINGIRKINLTGENWWEKYLDMFKDDYKKYKLGDERYLYSFHQYFPKLISYGNTPVRNFNQLSGNHAAVVRPRIERLSDCVGIHALTANSH